MSFHVVRHALLARRDRRRCMAACDRAVGAGPPGFSPLDKSNPAQSKQDTNLKPHPTPPIAAPVDKLPLDKIKLPAGFKAEVWSSGHPGARTMVMGDKGTIFMGTRLIGRVYAITDKDGKREAKVLLQGLTQPNGLAFKDGALYVFAINKVFRYDNIEDKLDNPGDPVELTDKFNLPDTVHHNWKYVGFGPDGKMYVQVGANCNICEINPGIHGQIRRYNAGRHRHGDRGARRAQHGRLRLASGDQGAVVHRQRPRLGRRRRTGGRAQPHRRRAGGRQLRLPVLPRQRHPRSGRQEAEPVRRRDACRRR